MLSSVHGAERVFRVGVERRLAMNQDERVSRVSGVIAERGVQRQIAESLVPIHEGLMELCSTPQEEQEAHALFVSTVAEVTARLGAQERNRCIGFRP